MATYRIHLLGLDNYPPLPCWMHSRTTASFDESFRAFAEWEFVLRMSRRGEIRYVPRVTYERRLGAERTAPESFSVAEAQRLMQSFPAVEPGSRRTGLNSWRRSKQEHGKASPS